MITVRIFSQSDGKITGFAVHGHSGTAEHGYDIVCAGVSSLTEAALMGITEHLHRVVDYEVASGELTMSLKDAPDSLTEAVLQTMLLGLHGIAQYSPGAVEILE